MKTLSLRHLFMLPLMLWCLVSLPWPAPAEDYDEPESSEAYSREELDQMLAPIALYPDVLLSQVLMASTYPVEVVEADRWVGSHPELKDAELDDALLDREWDPSVKALCHFPSILALMSERIGETEQLGDAFLAQEAEVMDVVQELRAKAHAQGNLAATAQQKVVVEDDVIVIEPTDPRVVYVPYYDPFAVYGPWWYPDYPPWRWGPPGVAMGVGLSFWPGVYFGFSFTNWSYFDWRHHYVHIDAHQRPRFVRHDRWRTTPGRWTRHSEPRPVIVSPPSPPTTVIIHQPWPPSPMDVRRDPFGGPEYYDRGHDWSGGDWRHIDRSRHERERHELEQRQRERDDHDKRDRRRDDRDREERPRVNPEHNPPGPGIIGNDPTRRQPGDRGPRLRDLVPPRPNEPGKQKPRRNDQDKQTQPGVGDDRPDRATLEPGGRKGKPEVTRQPPKPLEEVRKPPARPVQPAIDPPERKRREPAGGEDNLGKRDRGGRDPQPRPPQVLTPVKNAGGASPANVHGPDKRRGKGDAVGVQDPATEAGHGRKRAKPQGPTEETGPSVGANEL